MASWLSQRQRVVSPMDATSPRHLALDLGDAEPRQGDPELMGQLTRQGLDLDGDLNLVVTAIAVVASGLSRRPAPGAPTKQASCSRRR